MSFKVEQEEGGEMALVFSGHRNGIADSPYEGISDMRNVNIVPIPGEASVNFATQIASPISATGSVVSASSGADTITISGTAPNTGSAVIFSGGSLPSGITAGTTYWLLAMAGGTYQVYTAPGLQSADLVNITSDGTGTYATTDMALPKYFTKASSNIYFMVDASGRVWSNIFFAPTLFFEYMGNLPNNDSHGNGIIYYEASDGTGYVFVFSDSSIDYATYTGTAITWAYQWAISAGTVGSWNANPSAILKTPNGTNNNHEAILGPDNKVYYTDKNYIGRWYQSDPATPFVPTTKATYTFDQTAVLPFNDIANCLNATAVNGFSVIIGGQKNVAYIWDTVISQANSPVFLAENNIQKMVTVNTNTYIFTGNRGRIYVTNGSQAQFFKKLPDHLSGTVEPYYTWGGATSNKNQLYFSAMPTTNAGVSLNTMGGLWAIDLDNKAIRLVNELSYGTYAGYISAMIPNFSTTASGTGIIMGWYDGVSTYGVDSTISTPYTGSQAYIDYDFIPIGTVIKKKTYKNVEYKLSAPMVSGESTSIYYRLNLTNCYTLIFTSSTVGAFSDENPVPFENAQWIQLRAVTNSTASSPSYTRLTEVRLR